MPHAHTRAHTHTLISFRVQFPYNLNLSLRGRELSFMIAVCITVYDSVFFSGFRFFVKWRYLYSACNFIAAFFFKFLFFGLLSFSCSRWYSHFMLLLFSLLIGPQMDLCIKQKWEREREKHEKNIGWNKFWRVIENTFRIECACESDKLEQVHAIYHEWIYADTTTARDKMLAIDKCSRCRARHLRFSLTQHTITITKKARKSMIKCFSAKWVRDFRVACGKCWFVCQAHKSIAHFNAML